MKKILLALFGLAVAYSAGAQADDRELLVVGEMIEINAKPDVVWNIVKAFDGLVNWHPAFSGTPLIKGRNGQVGAVRALTIKDGPTFTEELVAYSEARKAFTYIIVESPLPLDHYQSSISVKANGSGGTTVAWIGTFTRKNPRNNVPEAETDAAVVNLIIGAYQAGLQTIKTLAEGK